MSGPGQIACDHGSDQLGQTRLKVIGLDDEGRRRLAVRRFESGNNTSTTSPRLKGIVDIHFRPLPVFGECCQSSSEIGSLLFVNPALS